MDDISQLEHDARITDSWNGFLDGFQERYETIFKPRGISYEAAITLWKLNMIYNELTCEGDCDCDAEN